ncbi:MAG TPA: NAD(P)/FAD-dependent oxidoreductase [Oscillospiraceae bacterium]|nr:NAD(P)/FAD-dependent oxidoreductase [Oscillospiraceae bacterium]
MAIIISEIETPIEASKNDIIELALKKAGISRSDILKAEIHKTSLDARKQDKIKFVSSVYAELKSEKLEINLCEKFKNCSIAAMPKLEPKIGSQKLDGRIAIAGFGPAGMFAALTLAEYGYKPIVIERGSNVEKRIQKVNNFWNNAVLDSECNVQFGEGGAGTFSDGKLTTRIKDPLCRHILEKFVEFGAPEEILVKAKPHIGTDKLRGVVKALREKIISLGGEILFDTKLLDIEIKNGRLYSISSSSGKIKTDALILAIGHSARDTFEMLAQKGVFMEPKAFSVGARIEHTQESVNKSLYGNHFDNPLLPQGEYQLSYRENERAVYTFCMCPG